MSDRTAITIPPRFRQFVFTATMPPRLRKFVLTAHVACSVGWLGAVVGSLALALAALTSQNPQVVRGAYPTMEVTGWFVLLPLSLASLLTGLVQSLGTPWGLFRHYWVLMKLLMNVFATVVLLLYMQTLHYLAGVAAAMSASGNLTGLRNPSPVLHGGGALLLLLVATTLSVYKPRGMTPYGWRKGQEQRRKQHGERTMLLSRGQRQREGSAADEA